MSLNTPATFPKLIVVMGVSGCGKSTLAERLARHYSATFLDADDFHSDEAKSMMAQGLPLTDELRLPWVDRIRSHLAICYEAKQLCVLAFSGLRRAHRLRLRETPYPTLFIFLDAKPQSIQSRILHRENHFMNPNLVESQFEALERPHQESDIIRLDADVNGDQVFHQSMDILDRYFVAPVMDAWGA